MSNDKERLLDPPEVYERLREQEKQDLEGHVPGFVPGIVRIIGFQYPIILHLERAQ